MVQFVIILIKFYVCMYVCALGGHTTIVCDAWPVRRKAHNYLPSLH